MAEETFDYKPDKDRPASKPKVRPVNWTASEFIDHKRGFGWYVMLVLATAATAAAVWLVTRDYFATGTIAVLGGIVGVYVRRKPRDMDYEISSSGVKIGDKTYDYGTFKSFSIINDGALSSLYLYPVKKYMPPISLFFAPEDEDKITKAIGDHLPYEERQLDGIDRLSRRLRL